MKKGLVVLAFVAVMGVSSQAALEQIVWGDYVGVTIKYNGVSETSDTDTLDINGDGVLDNSSTSEDGLYGVPRLDGDTLAFDDLDFFSSSNSSGSYVSDITDGKLAGQIEGKPNYYVNEIRFTEYGDAQITAPIPDTSYAGVSIANNIFVKIQEIDGVDVPDIVLSPISMVVTPQDQWDFTGQSDNVTWSGVVQVDITAELRALGYDGYATKVDFTLDNTLTSYALNGSSLIAKKESGGLQVETFTEENGIPEPATMFLLGLGSLVLRRRKK